MRLREAGLNRKNRIFGDDHFARHANNTAPLLDPSPVATWHWLKVTMEIRPVSSLCVSVCVCLTEIAGVLIYALLDAGVKLDACLPSLPELNCSSVLNTARLLWAEYMLCWALYFMQIFSLNSYNFISHLVHYKITGCNKQRRKNNNTEK